MKSFVLIDEGMWVVMIKESYFAIKYNETITNKSLWCSGFLATSEQISLAQCLSPIRFETCWCPFHQWSCPCAACHSMCSACWWHFWGCTACCPACLGHYGQPCLVVNLPWCADAFRLCSHSCFAHSAHWSTQCGSCYSYCYVIQLSTCINCPFLGFNLPFMPSYRGDAERMKTLVRLCPFCNFVCHFTHQIGC